MKHMLDDSARDQLTDSDFAEYEACRDRLITDGEVPTLVYAILSEMILDRTEEYEMEDYVDNGR